MYDYLIIIYPLAPAIMALIHFDQGLNLLDWYRSNRYENINNYFVINLSPPIIDLV